MKPTNLIADAYQRNSNRPVAYLDESLRGPQESGIHFYILTAVVVADSERDSLRHGIEEIVGGTFWHTSEEIQRTSGFAVAEELLTYLSKGDETMVVSVNTAIDSADTELEAARKHCMSMLLPALEQGSERRDPISLALLERRRGRHQQNKDTNTHRELVTRSAISRHFRLLQTSPADEHLLWLPDLVSSAVRRQITKRNDDLLRIIRSQIEWIK